MAALAHGRPVLGLRGHNTDRVLLETDGLALTLVGDPAAFSRAAVGLTRDPSRLREIGDAGRRLYETQFDWPVAARRVASALEAVGSRRSRPVVFVANELGTSGGMERQAEQLVTRLVDAGRSVTVITRGSGLAAREGLRFVRVRTPRRPFALAYPAFFAVASVLVARHRGDALVHTTGAIVANRADISTVHYCHRAAARKVDGSRASRPGLAYRINAAIAGKLSLAGEAWCYRPARTRLLCAVSGGVANELLGQFPAMRGAVRAVPNGVDSAVFRPDARARHEVRAQIGLDDRVGLALFVGGDWERKGLRYAVDALSAAPDWHLVVAGLGEPEVFLARARGAGSESRVHFAGPVRDTSQLYAAADAFVFPTAYEAFPLVGLEAAACGLPLLITRVNGVEDLLQDGHNGWFIDRDAADIAGRLRALRSDPRLARAMAAAARTAAGKYSWEAMATGYSTLYTEL